MTREVGNWLNGYLEYTQESESPDDFHVWTGLSCISSVARRRIWLHQGIYLLYCNLFTALVGPPGRTGKSTAMRIGRRLLREVPGVVFGPDSCSREQLIRSMAESKIDNSCAVTIHSSEFSSILDISGLQMIQFLTDIYDCDIPTSAWKYETKTSGKDQIINPFLTLHVGTTPTYIADAMPDNVVGHGFTSRMIFIYEEKERKVNPYPAPPNKQLEEALIKDLIHISQQGGEFQWDDPEPGTEGSGRKAYRGFYEEMFANPPEDHRLEGYHWRKRIHVLKVAMLLSLCERDELILDAAVINSAVQFLHGLEDMMAKTFSAVGRYDLATDMERIGAQIFKAGQLSVEEVFKRNYFVGSTVEIEDVLSHLVRMGRVRRERIEGKEVLINQWSGNDDG